MKTKEEIVQNWLPRYTGEKLGNFGKYILLTNFSNYVELFAEWNNVKIADTHKPMQCATPQLQWLRLQKLTCRAGQQPPVGRTRSSGCGDSVAPEHRHRSRANVLRGKDRAKFFQ